MKNFEAVLLLSSEVSSKSRSDCLDNFTKIIIDNSGKILDSEDWGLRDLSYNIKNNKKAFYKFYQIEIEGNKMKLNVSGERKVMGFLIARKPLYAKLLGLPIRIGKVFAIN